MQIDMEARRTLDKKVLFRNLWIKEQFRKLRRVFSEDEYSDSELQQFIFETYKSSKKEITGRLFNNVDKSNIIMSVENYINKYLNEDLILSGYNCLYKSHDDAINIGALALDSLLATRKKNKKKMEASEYGSNEYVYYKVLQLAFKVLANSYYGILGEANSIFYNSFVQNSITLSGQSLITTSITSMEAFLAGNFKFRNIDDFFTYSDNILSEQPKYPVLEYVKSKTSDEVFEYFRKKFHHETDYALLRKFIESLSETDRNRLYWKNNLSELLNLEYFIEKMRTIAQYEYTTEINENIKEDLKELRDMIIDICFYNHIFYDKYVTSLEETRDVICTVDTDSNFININGLAKQQFKNLNWENPSSIQNMTIVNIFIYICTEALERTFHLLTGNFGIHEEIRPKINMKNEFVYSRLLLTRNKKSYGGIILSELGRILKKPVTDIKGLAIRKTTISKKIRAQLTNLLTEQILKPEKISLKKILEEFDRVEESVESSLKEGSMEFSLPKNIELISNYANPASLEAVRGAIVWNALEPDHQIVPPEKVNILKLVTTTPDHPALEELKKKYPDKHKIIMDYCFNPEATLNISKYGFSVIAMPKSIESIPEYIKNCVDYETMINYNVSNGFILLESLGINIAADSEATKYKSNIIEL